MITPSKVWEAEQAMQAWQVGQQARQEHVGTVGQSKVRAILVRCRGIYQRVMLRAARRTEQPQANPAGVVR